MLETFKKSETLVKRHGTILFFSEFLKDNNMSKTKIDIDIISDHIHENWVLQGVRRVTSNAPHTLRGE